MARIEAIKDNMNRTIGYLEYQSNGDITAKDAFNRTVGYYVRSSNKTLDAYRRTVSSGDTTAALIMQSKR